MNKIAEEFYKLGALQALIDAGLLKEAGGKARDLLMKAIEGGDSKMLKKLTGRAASDSSRKPVHVLQEARKAMKGGSKPKLIERLKAHKGKKGRVAPGEADWKTKRYDDLETWNRVSNTTPRSSALSTRRK